MKLEIHSISDKGKRVSCQNARVNSTKNRVMKNQKTLSCSFNLNRKNN